MRAMGAAGLVLLLSGSALAGNHEIDPGAWRGLTKAEIVYSLGVPEKSKARGSAPSLVYHFPRKLVESYGEPTDPCGEYWVAIGNTVPPHMEPVRLRFYFDSQDRLERIVANRKTSVSPIPDFSKPPRNELLPAIP